MAISLYSSNFDSVPDGGNVTLDFFFAPPIQDDIVILVGGHGSTGSDAGAVTSGYTEILDTTATGVRLSISYKVMGVSPDTQVVGLGSGNASDAVTYACYIFRGVSTSNPIDAVTTSATGSSANPNSPSITTVTDGAAVISAFQTNILDLTTPTPPTGYSGELIWGESDTNQAMVGLAYKIIATAQAENPSQWTIGTSGNWVAASVALRPAGAGVITDGVASMTGSGTASFVGVYEAAGPFSMTGTGTANLVGNALIPSVLAATGQAAASWEGNSSSNLPAPFSMTGAGTASFVGALAGAGNLSATGRVVPDFSGVSINSVSAALRGVIGVQWVGATSKMESVREDIRSRGAATVNM